MKKLTKDLIIIPDVHGRTFWKECVEGREDQPIIFLGDYLDPYPYENISVEDAIINFEDILDFAGTHKNVILLLGNHDLGYVWGTGVCSCRHSVKYQSDIQNMFIENINLFKLAYDLEVKGQRYVFSHAGLTYEWLLNHSGIYEVFDQDTDNIVDFVNKQFNKGNAESWFVSIMSEYSRFRGQFGVKYGSPIWMDVREWIANKDIVNYAFQVFGHSQLNTTGSPIITKFWAALDCRAGFILDKDGVFMPIEPKDGFKQINWDAV